MTSFLALRFYEEGLLDFNDPVSKYIPSFHREWEVVKDAGIGTGSTTGACSQVGIQHTGKIFAVGQPNNLS